MAIVLAFKNYLGLSYSTVAVLENSSKGPGKKEEH